MTTIYGVDVVRAFELSWLNSNAKPELAIIEISQDFTKPPIQTWELKKFLESINNEQFANITAVKTAVEEFLKITINILPRTKFQYILFFEQQTYSDFAANLTFDFRFICEKSQQPYHGTLNLLCNEKAFDPQIVNHILNSVRNNKFIPQNFVATIYTKLSLCFTTEFIMSFHLNRRGGISYQALRSNRAYEFSRFSIRSILE